MYTIDVVHFLTHNYTTTEYFIGDPKCMLFVCSWLRIHLVHSVGVISTCLTVCCVTLENSDDTWAHAVPIFNIEFCFSFSLTVARGLLLVMLLCSFVLSRMIGHNGDSARWCHLYGEARESNN